MDELVSEHLYSELGFFVSTCATCLHNLFGFVQSLDGLLMLA